MAQGKLKVKSKVPMKAKNKARSKAKNTAKKNIRKLNGIENRIQVSVIKLRFVLDKPAPSKKTAESAKLKKIVTKNVNKTVEKEIRALASSEGKQKLSRVQKKVAELNKK